MGPEVIDKINYDFDGNLYSAIGVNSNSILNLSFFGTVPFSGFIYKKLIYYGFFIVKPKLNSPLFSISMNLLLFSFI